MIVKKYYQWTRLITVLLFFAVTSSTVPLNITSAEENSINNTSNQQQGLTEFQRTHAQLVADSQAQTGKPVIEDVPNHNLLELWGDACTDPNSKESPSPAFCQSITGEGVSAGPSNGQRMVADPSPDNVLFPGSGEVVDEPTPNNLTLANDWESYDLIWYNTTYNTGITPPDTMGVVGPTQFFVTQNAAYRVHDKLTGAADTSLDVQAKDFWPASVAPLNDGGIDPRVRFDRLTDQWIVTAFTRNNPNRILIARSDGPIISLATVWTYWYFLPGDTINGSLDNNCFADYPMLGVDNNAILIGANIFDDSNCALPSFATNTTIWVMPKTTLPSGGGDAASVTYAFTNLFHWTPMPADNFEGLTTSYVVSKIDYDQLDLGRITYSGGVPSLNWQSIVVSTSNFGMMPKGVPYPAVPSPTFGNYGLDPVGFRAIGGAQVRNGTLLMTMTSSVNGTAGTTTTGQGDRHSVVVMEIDVSSGAVVQDFNIYDDVNQTNPIHVWMGSAMTNGPGDMLIGYTLTNADTYAPSAGFTRQPYDYANNTYNGIYIMELGTNTGNMRQNFETDDRPTRWGDYSMTSLDPCDDMTLYTIQEYSAPGRSPWGGNWATRVGRFPASPPNATGVSIDPVPRGSTSENITITGTDFYDTPSHASPSCRTRIQVSTSYAGLSVNSVTYNSPTSVTLNLNTYGAACGSAPITITNPDGQTDTINIDIGTTSQCTVPNDLFPNATDLGTIPASSSQWLYYATTSGSDPDLIWCISTNYNPSIWYRFTAASDQLVTVTTDGSLNDTVLGAFTGTEGNLAQIACDDDSGPGFTSTLTFSTRSGQTYYLMVADFGSDPPTLGGDYSVISVSGVNRNDALVLFDSVQNIGIFNSVLNSPTEFSYIISPPTNTAPEWVMGDWNNDGVRTPGIFDSGAFRYTNDIGPGEAWSTGMWLGNASSRVKVVSGRFSDSFANDCIGWVDSNASPVTGDLRFSLKWWCDMSATGAVALNAQWLGAPLGDSQGYTGTHQWVYGDWNSDGYAEPAVRRAGRIARGNAAPFEGGSTFGTGAQRWDTADGDGPGAHGLNEGQFVAGDWNNDGQDSWGVVYDDNTFYYRDDISAFNPGPYQFQLQTFTTSVSTPRQVDSHWAASGGSNAPGPAAPVVVANNPTTTPKPADVYPTQVPPTAVPPTQVPPTDEPEPTNTPLSVGVLPTATDEPEPTLITPTPIAIEPTDTPVPTEVSDPVRLPIMEDMDDGAPNWLATGGWELSPNASYQPGGLGWQTFSTNDASTLQFYAPIILGNVPYPNLRFQSNLQASHSSAQVEISLDAQTWLVVGMIEPSAGWVEQSIDLSDYRSLTIYLRFNWVASEAPTGQSGDYWMVDEVDLRNHPFDDPTATPETFNPTATDVPSGGGNTIGIGGEGQPTAEPPQPTAVPGVTQIGVGGQ